MRSKDIKEKKVSWFDSLSDEQKKSINLFLDTEIQRKEMLKEIKPIDLKVNVITTYEHEEQEIFDLMIQQIYPNQVCSMITEEEVLSQVVQNLKDESDRDLDYLVKISLGYMEFYVDGELQSFTDYESRKQFLKSINMVDTIKRCNSKYYFQPNQRDIICSSLVKTFNVSGLTSDHDKQDYVNHMMITPFYLQGKTLMEEHKTKLMEVV